MDYSYDEYDIAIEGIVDRVKSEIKIIAIKIATICGRIINQFSRFTQISVPKSIANAYTHLMNDLTKLLNSSDIGSINAALTALEHNPYKKVLFDESVKTNEQFVTIDSKQYVKTMDFIMVKFKKLAIKVERETPGVEKTKNATTEQQLLYGHFKIAQKMGHCCDRILTISKKLKKEERG